MARVVLRNSSGVLRNSSGILTLDWSNFPGCTINAPNVGTYTYSYTFGLPPVYTYYWAYAGSRLLVKGGSFLYTLGDTRLETNQSFGSPRTYATASVRLKANGANLYWLLRVDMRRVTGTTSFVEATRSVTTSDMSPIGTYTYSSSSPSSSNGNWKIDGPYSLS